MVHCHTSVHVDKGMLLVTEIVADGKERIIRIQLQIFANIEKYLWACKLKQKRSITSFYIRC